MPWHKHTPQASNTFSRNSMTTRWLRLDFEAYECDRIQAEKEEAANTQASIGPMIEEGAQEQKEEEETRQGTAQTIEPQHEASTPTSTMETQHQQLDASAELHNDKSPNEEPPQAPTQPPTTLACTEPTTEVMNNIQTELRNHHRTSSRFWKKNEAPIEKCSVLAN